MDEPKTEAIAPAQEGQEPAVDVKALQEKLDQALRSQAGVDKSYAETAKRAKELETENERLKKERMSEKEKAEYEMAQKQAQLDAREREVADATLRFSKIRLLGEKNIPLEFADYIGGSNETEIATSLDTFMKRFDTAVQARVNEKLSGTQKPQAGTEPAKMNLEHKSLREIENLAKQGKL